MFDLIYDDEEQIMLFNNDLNVLNAICILNNGVCLNGGRGEQIFKRKRKNDPNQQINDGISTEEFKRLFRLTPEKFNLLLQLLNSRNRNKTFSKGRKPVADTTQLGLSLFFFGHLVDYVAAANFFGVAPSTQINSDCRTVLT